jgi:hypothetical protein
MPSRRFLSLLLLASLYTGLNALTPLRIDDAAYETYARHIARDPLDPYGFAVFWYDVPMRANEVLAPPVLPAYLALARRLVGERPWLWKLALWPWALLLVWALADLFHRFAPGPRSEVVGPWLVVFSPLLLPTFQLMLDVPALALSLAGLALFLRALERSSGSLAALAGLAAGLAIETKYTGALAPAVMFLAALTRVGRPEGDRPFAPMLLWGAAALTALHLFLGWELLVALLYGRSHFLLALSGGSGILGRLGQLEFLFTYLGGLAPAAGLIGLAALGFSRRFLLLAAGAVGLGFLLIALVGTRFVNDLAPGKPVVFELAEVVFLLFGFAGAMVTAAIAWKLWVQDRGPERRTTAFLLLWLGLEVAGYVPLTPFPAARRVLGVGIVLALIVGRLASRTCVTPERRQTLRALAAGGIALGLVYFALDWRGAWVHREAAARAAHWLEGRGEGRVWYVGHWGFQYYAERLGARPVVPLYDPPEDDGPGRPIPLPVPTVLRRGDWLVVPDARLEQQWIRLGPAVAELERTIVLEPWLPVRTMPCYYGGRTPLSHDEGNWLEVRIYRVREDFTPEPAPPGEASRDRPRSPVAGLRRQTRGPAKSGKSAHPEEPMWLRCALCR